MTLSRGRVSPVAPSIKNQFEAGVGLAQRRIIVTMELECTPMACDLDHLNEQGKAKLLTTRRLLLNSRRQMFEDEEREFLGRLPH